METQLTKTSKFLSYILRHRPDEIGLNLDPAGWVDISVLIEKANAKGKRLSQELLRLVVETNDKQRFAISEDGLRIRANQGHSIEVELALEPRTPPVALLHGTAERFMDAIRAEGLCKMNRHHVHLTESEQIARSVGARYGKPVLLNIDAATMHAEGFEFLQSHNGVWLTDHVPYSFITLA